MVGININTHYLKKNFPQSLEEKGAIKVNKFLQVEGLKNIFALGDITNIKEEKMAMYAKYHGKFVAKNLILLEDGKALKEYSSPCPMMLVSLGPSNGILSMSNRYIPSPGFVLGKLKNTFETFGYHTVVGCKLDNRDTMCATCYAAAKIAP